MDLYKRNRFANLSSKLVWYVDYVLKEVCFKHRQDIFKKLDPCEDCDPSAAIIKIAAMLQLNVDEKTIRFFRNDAMHGKVDELRFNEVFNMTQKLISMTCDEVKDMTKKELDFYISEIKSLKFRTMIEDENQKKDLHEQSESFSIGNMSTNDKNKCSTMEISSEISSTDKVEKVSSEISSIVKVEKVSSEISSIVEVNKVSRQKSKFEGFEKGCQTLK